MRRVMSCSMFNHYEQIKVNLKGLSRGETHDGTHELNQKLGRVAAQRNA